MFFNTSFIQINYSSKVITISFCHVWMQILISIRPFSSTFSKLKNFDKYLTLNVFVINNSIDFKEDKLSVYLSVSSISLLISTLYFCGLFISTFTFVSVRCLVFNARVEIHSLSIWNDTKVIKFKFQINYIH